MIWFPVKFSHQSRLNTRKIPSTDPFFSGHVTRCCSLADPGGGGHPARAPPNGRGP